MAQRFFYMLALFFFIAVFSSCEKDIDITFWEIGVKNSDPIFLDKEVRFYIKEYASSSGSRIDPVSYHWVIEDSLGNVIKDDFENSPEIKWQADETGQYEANVFVKYSRRATQKDSIIVNVVIDKRDLYTGNYKFIRYSYGNYEGRATRYDTAFTEGIVGKDSFYKNRFHIICGTGNMDFLFPWNETFSFDFDLYASNYNPYFGESDDSHYFFSCKFIGYDSLYIRRQYGGLAANTTYKYYGKKLE